MKVNSGYKVGVVVSCTNNTAYSQWIPYVVETWNKLGVDTILLGIDYDVTSYAGCTPIVINNPLKIKNSSIAQVIRLYYPGTLKEYDAIIIADIDQIPLPNNYFKKYIEQSIEQNTFIGMRFVKYQYFMGWNVAPPLIWSEVTGISDRDSLLARLDRTYSKYHPTWGLDQKLLLDLLQNFNNKVKVENLDLYSIEITDSKLFKRGLFENNKIFKKEINDLADIQKSKFIGAGTATARNFNKELLTEVINFFYNEDLL